MMDLVIKATFNQASINLVCGLDKLVKARRNMNNWKGGTKEVEGRQALVINTTSCMQVRANKEHE
jgi:hypothetical protein